MNGFKRRGKTHVLCMPTVAFLVSLFISATSMAQVEVVIVPPSTPAIAGDTTEINEGFLLASEVRGNPSTGKGSVQVDVTYPLSKVLFRNLDLYLYAQFFTGYGESLLEFDEKDTRIRLGVGIVR